MGDELVGVRVELHQECESRAHDAVLVVHDQVDVISEAVEHHVQGFRCFGYIWISGV